MGIGLNSSSVVSTDLAFLTIPGLDTRVFTIQLGSSRSSCLRMHLMPASQVNSALPHFLALILLASSIPYNCGKIQA